VICFKIAPPPVRVVYQRHLELTNRGISSGLGVKSRSFV
jgi:hypothetical protein